MRMPLVLFVVLFSAAAARGMEAVRVSDDGRGFVLANTGRPFVPRGLNYDHDERGRLIEDYWLEDWTKVEEDFGEMRDLGANVVRVHLQLGRFIDAADQPNEASLERLGKLVALAERLGLRLDVTGLGCYHKQDIPAWYDRLDEEARWDAQARFWQAVASRCAGSPAIFCYDLMNEPVVPGGKRNDGDWLGPAFAGKHFVQFVTLDARDRPRHEIARDWIRRLVAAVRKHDRRTPVTVGLVDWSLDRPGLTSGFVPEKVAPELDFLAIHLYPERKKSDEALKTLEGFKTGKPVVVEETFPLKCSAAELGAFMDRSAGVGGWFGFYWGKTADECRKSDKLSDAVTLSWLELFQERQQAVSIRKTERTLEILVGGMPVAVYVFADDAILRPYFRTLRTRSGIQVTRNHPPVKGVDPDDHATMHPGLWMAFGDLGGEDFWRNKSPVRHVRFLQEPKDGAFAVRNEYGREGAAVCEEDCRIRVTARPEGWLLEWTSTFRLAGGTAREVAFGDQEEMGLGLRVATPLAVTKGGAIVDAGGRRNERGVWGQQADWCAYGGTIDDRRVGVALMPGKNNFRPSWFHARDYGLLVANPFGRNAFTKDEKSRVPIAPDKELTLRFGVLVYDVPQDKTADIAGEYEEFSKSGR